MAEYEIPDDCRYSAEDEWVREESGRHLIGITDYAQQQLGDIVFVELPEVDDEIVPGESFGVVESVKAVAELFAPVAGTVVEVNGALTDTPELVNSLCYEDGWIIAISVDHADSSTSALDSLMDAAAYRKFIAEREG